MYGPYDDPYYPDPIEDLVDPQRELVRYTECIVGLRDPFTGELKNPYENRYTYNEEDYDFGEDEIQDPLASLIGLIIGAIIILLIIHFVSFT